MASQMLASVKGMSACTTPNEASASNDRGFLWGVTADPDLRQDADRRYLRLGVRHKLNRTADLDDEVDAAFDRRSAHYDVLDRREQPP